MGPIQADTFSSTDVTYFVSPGRTDAQPYGNLRMLGVLCQVCDMPDLHNAYGCLGKAVMHKLTLGRQSGRIVTSVSASINYSQTSHSRTILLT